MKKEAWTVLKAIGVMCIITGLLLLTAAMICYRFHFDDRKMGISVGFIYFAAAFAGGLVYGISRGKNRFLYGSLMGVLYFIALMLLVAAKRGIEAMTMASAGYAFLLCLLGGMTGGMASNCCKRE